MFLFSTDSFTVVNSKQTSVNSLNVSVTTSFQRKTVAKVFAIRDAQKRKKTNASLVSFYKAVLYSLCNFILPNW